MRTVFCSICAFFLFICAVNAQNFPDLRTAVPLYPDAPINGMANGSGDIDDFDLDVTLADINKGTTQPIRYGYEVNSANFEEIGINLVNGQQGGPPLRANQNTYGTGLDVKAGFLGLDIKACQADPNVTLSALGSPAGADIQSVSWTVDYDDDGIIDDSLSGRGPFNGELVVPMTAFTTGRYYVEIQTISGTPLFIKDDILITVYGTPELREVKVLTDIGDKNDIEIVPLKEGEYEYSLNGGSFQESPIFLNVPSGRNTVAISNLNGCGTSDHFQFFIVGYPKFFTPNADGVHDEWNIDGLSELETATIYIFDRYGKLLKQLDKTSTGWDGALNGRPMPSSDYWFRMEYSREEEGTIVAHTLRSHFTLKR